MDKSIAEIAGRDVTLPADSREWFYFPIIMPLDKNGRGPAAIEETAEITWQVWDQYCDCHGSHGALMDAINQAIALSVKHLNGE